MSFARLIATWLSRWPLALLACGLLAAAVILPQLGGPGLWEPQERQLADRAAPPLVPGAAPASPAAQVVQQPGQGKDCLRAAPADAAARTLTPKAVKWGRDTFGDSDTGRRLPLALLGWLTVLAAAGIALRLASPRAAVVTAIVLLAMPLMTLQARMLTSEIGTACGAALIIYGLVALATPGAAWSVGRRALDTMVGLAALLAGAALGFFGGGVLLGLIVPLGAVAVAGGCGVAIVGAVRRRASGPGAIAPAIIALIAALATAALVVVLARQLYDLKTVYPGLTPPPAREVLGQAIIPTGCYSWALGGVWRPEDDLRAIFDSTFEQIAYGTFPWGLVAPIAMAMLVTAPDPRRRRLGALALAWAGAAWVAGEAFERKVGFTVYAGFPALAIAVGGWLDDVLSRRANGEPDAVPPGAPLIALFIGLGVLDLGKDMQSFAERLTSLFVGSDGVPYPAQSHFLWLPTRLWVLILGLGVALAFALAIALGRRTRDSEPGIAWYRIATGAAIAALGGTIVLAAFWSAIWQPELAINLSSKAMLETYQELAKPGDELVVLGDLGQAPLAYTGKPPQTVNDRSQVIAALGRPGRVFAIAPQTELCPLHRELGGKPYFVVDDRNQRSLLLSNRVDGTTDKNPLRTAILHQEPAQIANRPKAKIVFDNKIQLLGWDLPQAAPRGAPMDITVYYKVLAPVTGSWKAFMHFDGPAGRAGNGDHDPINGRCATSTWQNGDYIVDRFTVRVGGGAFPSGRYDVWAGFFTGTAPSFKNMPVSEAPGDLRDTADRVKLTSIVLE